MLAHFTENRADIDSGVRDSHRVGFLAFIDR